jgi:hypothetical protein
VDESGEPLSKGSAALVDDGALAVQPTAFCGGPLEAGPWRRNTREHFMNVYAWSGAMARVDQTLGAASSHTLGIAVRTPEGWGASGTSTRSISNGAGQEVTGVADAGIWNSWNYRDFYGRTTAGPINCIKVVPVSIYDIFNEPYTYAGHQNFSQACVRKSRGATLRKNTAKNVTYSTGVDIGPFSVSAQSGYNEGTEVRWGVTRNSRACGNNPDGWIHSSEVDVRAR